MALVVDEDPLFLPSAAESNALLPFITPHVPTLCTHAAWKHLFFSPLPGKIHGQDLWRRSVRAKAQQVVLPSGRASLKPLPFLPSFLFNLPPTFPPLHQGGDCCDLRSGFFFFPLQLLQLLFLLKQEKKKELGGHGGGEVIYVSYYAYRGWNIGTRLSADDLPNEPLVAGTLERLSEVNNMGSSTAEALCRRATLMFRTRASPRPPFPCQSDGSRSNINNLAPLYGANQR